jgi:hypothetical protein
VRVRNHKGFGHGLAPGLDHDMNCPSCIREHKNKVIPDITGSDDMPRRKYGDRDACGTCAADIEFTGSKTWQDRGGNTRCDTSGHSYVDADGVTHRYPHRKHRPGSVFILPPGARRNR